MLIALKRPPSPAPRKSETGKLILLVLCQLSAFGAWFFFYSRFLANYYYADNKYAWPLMILQCIPAWLASGMAWQRPSTQKLLWIGLTLALSFWPVANILEQFVIGVSPGTLISAGQGIHILTYAAIFLVILLMAPVSQAQFGRIRYQIDIFIHAASWGLLLWVLLGAPLLGALQFSDTNLIWPILYAIFDLVILMLLLWFQGQSGSPSRALWLVTVSFFLFSGYDLATGWISLQSGSVSYLWLGFISMAGYCLLTWAMVIPDQALPVEQEAGYFRKTIQSFRRKWQRIEERWLPMASTIALITLLVSEWNRTGRIDPAITGCAVGLCLLLFLREGVIAGQIELAGYRVLLDNLSDPAFICRSDGRVLLENPALHGWKGAKGTGFFLEETMPVEPGWKSILQQAEANGWEGEVLQRMSSHAGQPAWLVVRPLSSEPGEGIRFACLLHDLSPQRRQENALREAIQRAESAQHGLQQLSERLEDRVREQTADLSRAMAKLEDQNRALLSLDRMKSDFVALTSHELRTPLAGIRAGLEWALHRKPALPKDAHANLKLAFREAERLSHFVEDVLDLSALEAGKLPMQIGPLAVRVAWEQARSALCSAHGGWDSPDMNRLTDEFSDTQLEVMADEHILASVLFQLVDNAFKYAPLGRVTVTVAPAGTSMVEINVVDEGPGLTQAERERLFVSFSRLDNADSPRTSGIGLGLYLSRRMIETMGGQLESPITDKGLAMRILLPIYWEPE
jgi:signal transduction histidine kinase